MLRAGLILTLPILITPPLTLTLTLTMALWYWEQCLYDTVSNFPYNTGNKCTYDTVTCDFWHTFCTCLGENILMLNVGNLRSVDIYNNKHTFLYMYIFLSYQLKAIQYKILTKPHYQNDILKKTHLYYDSTSPDRCWIDPVL